MDDGQDRDQPGWRAGLATRLAGRGVLLAGGLGLLLALALAQRLSPGEAAAAAGGLLLLAVIAPQRAGGTVAGGVEPPQTPRGTQRVAAIGRFADTLADPCLILDRRSVVLHRNPAAQSTFPAAVTGSPVILALRWPALAAAIEAARTQGTHQRTELHLTVPTETWYEVGVAPLGDEAGEPPAGLLVITLRDLTDERRVDQMRRDFIANASHELRTPLTSLMGFIDTLLGPAARDSAARERFLGIMRQQATRMSKLIDDLLSLSRIEMRQHMRPTGAVELSRLLREVGEGLQTQAAEAAVTISFVLPEAPVLVTGERDELYEVFENLLDNAVKYGGDGGSVEVTLAPSTGRPGYDWAVTVTDHGAGIEAEHVPRLTERFYRVDADSSRKKKGTGLGLAIVKHIVTRHRGLLSIRSRPGEGTRVDVLLPR